MLALLTVGVCVAELRVTTLPVFSQRNRLVYDMHAWKVCPFDQGRRVESVMDKLSGSKERLMPIVVDGNVTCTQMCTVNVTSLDIKRYMWAIDSEYMVKVMVEDRMSENEFKLGYRIGSDYFINNHLRLRLQSTGTKSELVKPTRVIVEAVSRKDGCSDTVGVGLMIPASSSTISFSYEVIWEDELPALGITHWKFSTHQLFNAVTSCVIVLMVVIAVLLWLKREIGLSSEHHSDSWRSLHAEVFRKPSYPRLFSCLVGVGVGISCVLLLLFVARLLEWVEPGDVTLSLTRLSLLSSPVAGYVTSNTFLYMGGKRWEEVSALTSLIIPIGLIWLLVTQSLFVWYSPSAPTRATDPMVDFFGEASLLTLAVVVLIFIGGKIGSGAIKPVTSEATLTKIPRQQWYMKTWLWSLTSAVLVYIVFLPCLCLVHASFLLDFIWKRHMQSISGVVGVVSLMSVFSCLLALASTYCQLCHRDYKWHWRSFCVGGSPGLVLIAHSVYYFFDQLDRSSIVAAWSYFGYMTILSASVAAMMGALGSLASFRLVGVMYLANKVD